MMRTIAALLWVGVGSVVLTGCDDTSKVVSSTGFNVSKDHDPLDGDIVLARRSFTNSDGYAAQVTLKCVADAKTFALNEVQDLPDVNNIFQQIYSGAWSSGLAGTGIQFGCPEGFQCAVVARVAFLTPDKRPDAPTITDQAQHRMVVYESKDAAASSAQYFTLLERAGSAHHDSAVDFLVPTEGRELTMWFYRFHVKGDDKPVEVFIDYLTPALVNFVQLCNSRLPQQSDPDVIK